MKFVKRFWSYVNVKSAIEVLNVIIIIIIIIIITFPDDIYIRALKTDVRMRDAISWVSDS